MNGYRLGRLGGLLLATAVLAGCASPWTKIAPDLGAGAQTTGSASGSAHGQLVSPGIGTAYYFWPAYLNSRMQRAYDAALASAPGSTALEQVTLQETWYWWIFGTGRKVTISGTGVAQ